MPGLRYHPATHPVLTRIATFNARTFTNVIPKNLKNKMSKNQTAISARIDNHILWILEQETMVSGRTRNRMINEGAAMYVRTLDMRREYQIHQNPDIRRKILKKFLLVYFPEAADSL